MKEELKQETKIYRMLKILFSMLFSAMMTLDRIIVYPYDNVFAKTNEAYFKSFTYKEIIFFVIITIITIFIIDIANIILNKIKSIAIKTRTQKNKWYYYLIFTFIIILLWMPYILSFFPGGIYSDTTVSISQAIGESKLNNHNPILYAMLLKFFIKIANNNLQIAMSIFTVFQVLISAMVLSYFVYFLDDKNISKKIYIPVLLFFSLFRLIPLFTLSLWKDVWFSDAMMLYCIFIIKIVYNNAENLNKLNEILKYVILMLLVAFLRNNGIYVVILTTIAILIIYRKHTKELLKKFTIISITSVVIIWAIRGPIYSKLGLSENETMESFGVILQQVVYTVVTDGNLTEDDINFINQICPISTLKVIYTPCTVDSLKGHISFNKKFLTDNKKDFIIKWIQIGVKNPGKYVKAFLMETLGFWNTNRASFASYIQPSNFSSGGYYDKVVQHDYFDKIFGYSIKNKAIPKKAVSHAIYFWIMLWGILNIIKFKNYKYILVYIPSIILYITLLLATPIAFSLRYIYILLLQIPFAIILPMINKNE